MYGFITTRLPLTALCDCTAAASSRSATNCTRSSMVSVIGVPGRGSRLELRIDAAPLHVGEQPQLARPGRAGPHRATSRCPALPFSSKSTPPIRCAASVPFGIVALALALHADPVEIEVAQVLASSYSTLRLIQRKPR